MGRLVEALDALIRAHPPDDAFETQILWLEASAG
jgi:hypothetical protein